jgi:hypothetical protein
LEDDHILDLIAVLKRPEMREAFGKLASNRAARRRKN